MNKKKWAIVRLNGVHPLSYYVHRKTAERRAEERLGPGRYEVLSVEQLQERRSEEVTVKSLMTGNEVQIPRSAVGGACDPSMECYWTL